MADAFYTSLVTFDDVISNTEEVSQILEETVWEDPNVSTSLVMFVKLVMLVHLQ